jgi:AraC-like DNA-binding protein
LTQTSGRAEAVLADLLQPVAMTAIRVRLPVEERARQVAQALTDNPADGRTLEQWGHQVGASGRTLARGFTAGTGLPFGRWRALLRLQAALPALAAGQLPGLTHPCPRCVREIPRYAGHGGQVAASAESA